MEVSKPYLLNRKQSSDPGQVVTAYLFDIHECLAEADWVYRRFRSLIERDPPPNLTWIEWWPISDN